MGLIKAITGATGGVLADQWKEFFYCDAIPADILITKGYKRLSSQDRSSNTTAEDNIISSGSGIAVNAGQCMLIVEDGKVVELCAEPGRYTYDASSEPSIMNGQGLGDLPNNLITIFKNIGRRFTYGGDPGKDQRVYFINIKEIVGNKYGTPSGIPFHICDKKLNVDLDIEIRCFGEYSYRITNPLLFYTNVSANVADEYSRDNIDSQLKSSVLSSLQDAFAKVSAQDIRYSQITAHTNEVRKALNEVLSADWRDMRGIEIVEFNVSSVKVTDEYAPLIKDLNERQLNYGLKDPGMAAAHIAGGTIKAMQTAAANESGGLAPMMGFMGMNMAGGMGGTMYGAAQQQAAMQQQMQMQQQQQMQQPAAPAVAAVAGWTCACGHAGNTGKFCAECGAAKPEPKPAGDTWTCACGHAGNTGNFCAECGAAKPAAGWTCTCGQVNQGKFCPNCGAAKPAGAPLYKCDKCGWQPEDPHNPPKFCPQCGDRFDENDQVK